MSLGPNVLALWQTHLAPEDASPAEKAWHLFGLRTMQAVRMTRHPSYNILKGDIERRHVVKSSASPIPRMTNVLPTRTKAISSMRKTDLQTELESYGYNVEGASVAQLKQVLHAVRSERETNVEKPPKGIGAMNRADLEAACRGQGLPTTGTCDAMRLALRGWDPSAATSSGIVANPTGRISGDDQVMFGRHRGKTYRQVLQENPRNGYASWVMHTVHTSHNCSRGLIRLSRYLQANGVDATMMTEAQEPEDWDIEIENPETGTEDAAGR